MKKILTILFFLPLVARAQQTFVTEAKDTVIITPRIISINTNDVVIKPFKPPVPPPVGTNNFYISATGNDANNGSIATPWKTLAKVNSRTFLPSDSILLNRGDMWREQITIPSSGIAGKPITFGAYGTGAKPIINGANLITTGWAQSGNIWNVINPNATIARAMVIIDDSIFSEASSLAAVSPGKYFISAGKVYIYSVANPAGRKVEISKRDYGVVTASGANSKKYIEVCDLEVRYAGRAGIYFEGPYSSGLNGFSVVRRCLAYANRLFGIAHYDHYDNLTVEDCEANYNGNGLYSWVADEGTFRRCSTANQIHYEATSGFTDGGGIQGYQADNWIVENCVSNNDYDAIHTDCGGVAANFIMRYNKIFNSRAGSPNTPTIGVGSLAAGATGQIYYNLMVNGASNAFECYTKMNGRVEVYNNTIYLKPGTGTDGTIYLQYGDNFIFKNNIITREGATRVLFTVFNPAPTVNDYNLYYNFPPVYAAQFYYRGYFTNLAAWKATGQDMNSIAVDPLFVNKASDWSLQAGSPAINKGVNVGLTKDILGNPIVGLPDLGAYEKN